MERKRKDILKLWKSKPYLEFGKHKKLVALSFCPDPYCELSEYDYDEVVFTVPVEWLLNWLSLYDSNYSHWGEEEMLEWLQEVYTSEESEQFFENALEDQKIVTLNFDLNT